MMRCQWWIHSWFAKSATKYLGGSEILHCWSQWGEESLKWASKHGIPTVLERSSAHISEQSRILREEYKRFNLKWPATHRKIEDMELREYKLADCIAVPSLFVQRTFEVHEFAEKKLYRNMLGVNIQAFQQPAEPPKAPSEEGLNIIYAGSLSLRKGIPDLLDGFAAAKLPKATLTLVGGITPEIRGLLKEQSTNVRHLGHRPQNELPYHYGQSHCFVMASVEEGMAMVQVQAMACGLPLICTTNTGGEDLLRLDDDKVIGEFYDIKEFSAGFLIPIHRPNAIAKCLRRLAHEDGLWEKKRRAALRIAVNKLSWKEYRQRSIINTKNYTTNSRKICTIKSMLPVYGKSPWLKEALERRH